MMHHVIDQAFSIIEQVQSLMSFHDVSSELSMLNQQACQLPVQVHPWTYAVIKRANRIFKASNGLFDCTIANTLVDWEMLPKHFECSVEKNVTQADVVLLDEQKILFKKPLWLDLGGIAKGFAVDLVIHFLRKNEIHSAIVNAGGDLRILGKHAEKICVRHPKNPIELLEIGELANGAIATSSSYFSEKMHNSQIVNALINPFSRQANLKKNSYSVIAPCAYIADALTKVVALSGDPDHPCLKKFAAQAFVIE